MRLLITRPKSDAEKLQTALAAIGCDSLSAPLLEIDNIPDAILDWDKVQALLITSANGAKSLANREIDRRIPIFAVGDASGQAAREIGFRVVSSADGDVSDLARLVTSEARPQDGTLLHVAGSRVAGDLAEELAQAGFTLRRAVLYEARVVKILPDNLRNALQDKILDGALFFSPRTARAFVNLVQSTNVGSSCETLTAYCLSAAVAKEIRKLAWRREIVAVEPTQAALLQAIVDDLENA